MPRTLSPGCSGRAHSTAWALVCRCGWAGGWSKHELYLRGCIEQGDLKLGF